MPVLVDDVVVELVAPPAPPAPPEPPAPDVVVLEVDELEVAEELLLLLGPLVVDADVTLVLPPTAPGS
jgi:hypothetical protein